MNQPYKSLMEAMRNDVTVHNAFQSGRSMSELALMLANQKKALVEELIELRLRCGPVLVETREVDSL